MRLIYSLTRYLSILPGNVAAFSTPQLRQFSVKAGDEGYIAPIRGRALEAIECPAPRVTFIVDVDGDSSRDALLVFNADLVESVWSMDESDPGPDVIRPIDTKITNVSSQLVGCGGTIGGNLVHAAVSSLELRLANVSVFRVPARVRVDVYSDKEAV